MPESRQALIHQDASDAEPEQIMDTRAWRECDDCGVLYTDAYCPRCEEMS